MNRKASSVLVMIIEILVVLVVGMMITKYAIFVSESDAVIRINLVNNLQMMVNAIIATPGESVVSYPYNVSKFNLVLTSGGITVTQKEDLDLEKVTRTFVLPAGYKAEGVLQEKEKVCLEKKSKKILLRECGLGE